MKQILFPLFFFGIIIIISLFAASPSFKLALFGDDWQQIWHYFYYVGPKANIIDHLTYFISGYGAFELTSGVLYYIFGHDYKMYYILSYLYKLFAAFSIIPLVLYLTRSKLAAFYASLFVSITTIGLESTNWVINSPAYLAAAFLSLFLYFFVKSREDLKLRTSIFAIIFFYLAHVFAPVRMTGLLPFVILFEIFLNFRNLNIKLSLKRLTIFLSLFAVISITGASAARYGTLLGGASTQLLAGISQIFTMINQGRSDFLFYPIMTVGRIIIPSTVAISVPTLFLSILIFLSVLFLNIQRHRKIVPIAIITLSIWSAISLIIYEVNKSTLSQPDTLSLVIGGFALLIGTTLLIINKKQLISIAFFIGVFWTIFSFLFPWFRSPETLLPTDQRYLVTSTIGLAVLLAGIIGLGKKSKNRIYLFLLLLPFILIQIITTRAFFIDAVENSHGKAAIEKIWSTFPYIPEVGKTEKPLVFYFDSTPEKGRLKHHSLTFGFPYRMAFMYNIFDNEIGSRHSRMPISTNDWKDIVSAVTDGKSLPWPNEPVPIENIYAFFLKSDNTLLNITEEARSKLKQELK